MVMILKKLGQCFYQMHKRNIRQISSWYLGNFCFQVTVLNVNVKKSTFLANCAKLS